MKNKDLVKLLKEMDPEAEVLITSGNFELNYADVSLTYAKLYPTGSCKNGRFRDAFDGCSYSHTVWSTSGGTIPVIIFG